MDSTNRATRDRLSVLPEDRWTALEAEHETRVDAVLARHRSRAAEGRKHPVEDFLFTYYSYRPARLRRWHPGPGFALAGHRASERLTWRDYADLGNSPATSPATSPAPWVGLDVDAFMDRRGDAVRHVRALLAATASRAPQLGCFGLHEWAMAYRATPDQLRHTGWPLRLGRSGTDEVVEANRLRCSHFDAFRFFTPAAAPRNETAPTRPTQIESEQPGCVHATMDLYKWAYKLAPATPSDLVMDCLDLARRSRVVDMRAAPYDLAGLGVAPIPIETADGKAEYVRLQRELSAAAVPLRERLIDLCDLLMDTRVRLHRPSPAQPAPRNG